jgi:hypothetical protein
MKKQILLFFVFSGLMILQACSNKKESPVFVEKSKIEITQNESGTWNFKNLGGNSSGLIVEMNMNGGDMTVEGFYAGTLLVVGESGLTLQSDFAREGYTIGAIYKFQKGNTIEVRTEGKITPNLKFVRDGNVVTDFKIMDSTKNTVMSNKRTIMVSNGRVQKVFFEDITKPKVLKTTSGKIIDLKDMTFELK